MPRGPILNYWYEYLLSFLLGLTGCALAAIVLDRFMPLDLIPYMNWRN
jgi:hypothetical protein